jgi:hypothetical protein
LAPSCQRTTLPSLLRTTYLYWMCILRRRYKGAVQWGGTADSSRVGG